MIWSPKAKEANWTFELRTFRAEENDANENKIYGTGLFGCGIGNDLGFKTPTGRFRGGIMICHDREMDDKEGVFVHELDFDALNKHRATGIYGFHHRWPELYGILCDPAGQVHPDNANLPELR